MAFWQQEKKRAKLYLGIATVVATLTILAIVFGPHVGCSVEGGGDTPPAPGPTPPAVKCGDLELGETTAEACPTGPTQQVSVCQADGTLKVVVPCPGGGGGNTGGDDHACDGKVLFDPTVKQLIDDKCIGCHRADRFDEYGIAKGKVDAFLNQIKSGRMPKGARLPAAEKDALAKPLQDWKAQGFKNGRADCAQQTPSPGPQFVSLDDVRRVISADIFDVNKVPEKDRVHTRYAIATDAINQGRDPATAKKALVKALNNISSESEAHDVVEIAPGIYRYDERWFGLDEKGKYALIEKADVLDVEDKSALGIGIAAATKTRKPWFHVSNLTEIVQNQASTYYTLAEIPAQLGQLLAQQGVDANEQLRDREALFIGLQAHTSPLSAHPRLIVRFEGDNGDFWITFDTGPEVDAANNLPQFFLLNGVGGSGKTNFRFAASEVLFRRKNGTMGAALFNAAGVRLDKADVTIVSDYETPQLGLGAEIVDPKECGRCHAPGLLVKSDQILAAVIRNAAQFDQKDVDKAKELYRDSAHDFAEDNEKWAAFAQKVGLDVAEVDPVTYGVLDYHELPWNAVHLCGFLHVEPVEACRALLNQSGAVHAAIGALLDEEDGTASFDQIQQIMPEIKKLHVFEDQVTASPPTP